MPSLSPAQPSAQPPATILADLAALRRLARAMREDARRIQREQDAFWRACAARAAARRRATPGQALAAP